MTAASTPRDVELADDQVEALITALESINANAREAIELLVDEAPGDAR
jgi:hypothetical protein